MEDDLPTARPIDRVIDGVLRRSPLQLAARSRARGRLAVLAYHGVDRETGFEKQVRWLADNTSVISLDQLLTHLTEATPLPPRPCLITFDDGRVSVHHAGLPVLRSLGLPAVVFVVAGLIGRDEPYWWDHVKALVAAGGHSDLVTATGPIAVARSLKRVPNNVRLEAIAQLQASTVTKPDVRSAQLDVNQLRDLEAAGIEVASHSWSHPCLDQCSAEVVHDEVRRAHTSLTGMLDHPPRAFAYPNGNVTSVARAAVRDEGYPVAFAFDHALQPLPINDPLVVARVRVNSEMSLDRFATVVSGLHPWVLRRLKRVSS